VIDIHLNSLGLTCTGKQNPATLYAAMYPSMDLWIGGAAAMGKMKIE